MTRQTSIDCYKEIKEKGLLSKRRLEVLEAISLTAPCTASEALVAINTSSLGIGSRFTELRDMGVIKEIRVRKCRITNRNVIEWDLTGELPVKITRKTKAQKKKEILNEITNIGQKQEVSEEIKISLRKIFLSVQKL